MALFDRLFTRPRLGERRSTIRIVEPYSGRRCEQIPFLRFQFGRLGDGLPRDALSQKKKDGLSRSRSYEASRHRVSIFYNFNGVAVFLRAGDCFCRETERGMTEIAAVTRFKKLGQMGFHVEFQQKTAVQKFILSTQTELKTLALDVFLNTYRTRYSQAS